MAPSFPSVFDAHASLCNAPGMPLHSHCGYVDEEGRAVPVTEARRLRVGMLEGSDDRSERQIAQVRYLGQRMQIFV